MPTSISSCGSHRRVLQPFSSRCPAKSVCTSACNGARGHACSGCPAIAREPTGSRHGSSCVSSAKWDENATLNRVVLPVCPLTTGTGFFNFLYASTCTFPYISEARLRSVRQKLLYGEERSRGGENFNWPLEFGRIAIFFHSTHFGLAFSILLLLVVKGHSDGVCRLRTVDRSAKHPSRPRLLARVALRDVAIADSLGNCCVTFPTVLGGQPELLSSKRLAKVSQRGRSRPYLVSVWLPYALQASQE